MWAETGVYNGGLSIYFPLSAYYETYSYTRNTASNNVKIYREVPVNEDYKQTVARFALTNLAGKLIGADWNKKNITNLDTLLESMQRNDNWNNDWKVLYEKAGVTESEDDPVLRRFTEQLEDRITTDKIKITIPEDDDHIYEDPAQVEIAGTEAVLVGDTVNIKVELFDKDINYIGTLGTTSSYSAGKQEVEKDGQRDTIYLVNSFNNVWHLLNNQICSLYVTKVNEDGSYRGYIPVCQWNSAGYASKEYMNDGETRNAYLLRLAEENNLTTIYLNVYCEINEKGEENFAVIGYSTVNDNGAAEISDMNMYNLDNYYYELLGGADEFTNIPDTSGICSLGTVYYDPTAGFSVTDEYVAGLSETYYVSDIYGNDYYLTECNLGKDNNLDDFYDYNIDSSSDNVMTWEKSQKEADRIREEAAVAASKEASDNNVDKSVTGTIDRSVENTGAKEIGAELSESDAAATEAAIAGASAVETTEAEAATTEITEAEVDNPEAAEPIVTVSATIYRADITCGKCGSADRNPARSYCNSGYRNL